MRVVLRSCCPLLDLTETKRHHTSHESALGSSKTECQPTFEFTKSPRMEWHAVHLHSRNDSCFFDARFLLVLSVSVYLLLNNLNFQLISGCHFRIQYSSYFSWYSTIGLILMTSLFLVMIPLLTLVGYFSNRTSSTGNL